MSLALPQWSPASTTSADAPIAFDTPYAGYTYAYPHKSAYRPLQPPRPLSAVWAAEPKDALYLYVHVPFCEMRCGFCNLFTTANPRQELTDQYLAALWRQAQRVRAAVGDARFARVAIGGGTPTFLSGAQLAGLFRMLRELFGVDCASLPASVETSPRTAAKDRLRVLREHGVDRVSIGVQSFVEAEVAASGRAQKTPWVDVAIERIRALEFETLNVDLIYGLPGQTVASWQASLRHALRWWPEEMYLYPLYVRPLTGLARHGRRAEDELRLGCYRAGRDLLLSEGYEQVSMRMFRRARRTGQALVAAGVAADGPVYCCQEDGMVGLGCGARSYARRLHYSSDYAVGGAGVREIIDRYVSSPEEAFDFADYGCELDQDEQRRRWVIKSLLRTEGMDLGRYQSRFGKPALEDLPVLRELLGAGFLEPPENGVLVPTPAGLEHSDAIGPRLYSDRVRRAMETFNLH